MNVGITFPSHPDQNPNPLKTCDPLFGTTLAVRAGMNAYVFRIDLPNDRRQAVVCVEARYVSVLAPGRRGPERRELSEVSWWELSRELAYPLSSAPLPQDSAVVYAMVDAGVRSAASVQYLMVLPVEPSPDDLERRLDALHIGFGGLYLTGRLERWSLT